MSFFLPIARPARCSPRIVRNDFAPLLSLIDDAFSEAARASRHARRPQFVPHFNVSEGKDYYTLEGELPGIDQDKVSVEFTAENTLTVRGHVDKHTRSSEVAKPSAEPHHIEASQAPPADDAEASPASEASETQSVRSHQPTVEDEKDWEAVDTPATTETASSTATATATAPAEETSHEATEEQGQQPEQSTTRPWLSERFVGDFSRSFTFAERVDQQAVRASLRNGILSVVVPKAAKPENRRVTIE